MNYLLGLTIIGALTGAATGVIGAGPEVLIVPLLAIFGLLESTKKRNWNIIIYVITTNRTILESNEILIIKVMLMFMLHYIWLWFLLFLLVLH